MNVVRCAQCGGAIASAPGTPEPACLFCGHTVLAPVDPDLVPPAPEAWMPHRIDEGAASAAFKTFARGSWFAPRALRDARLRLRRVLVPAWQWRLGLDVTWTGLVSAATRSGKRPVRGATAVHDATVMVPASATLTQRELDALGPFDDDSATPWDPDHTDAPWEVAEVSRHTSQARAERVLADRVARRVSDEESLRAGSIHTRWIPHEEASGTPRLVPIWIGIYTWKDVPRRVVINGHTGAITGDRPLDPWRVAAAVVAGATLVAGLVLAASALGG